MRKITQEAIESFMHGINYSHDNTTVSIKDDTDGDTIVSLFLHGNRIAVNEKYNHISITTAGWPTRTTCERLRAIPGVESLKTKNGVLFLNGKEWDGQWTSL